MDETALRANLGRIRDAIAAAGERSGRDPAAVRLIAATKTVPIAVIDAARGAGVTEVGENYVRELRDKRGAVPDLTWHFIGTLQTNSVHHVAELADVVQTVVPGRATARLARRAAERGRTIPALLEVDLTGQRTGVAPEAVGDSVDELAGTEGLALCGLMTLPPIPEEPEDARPAFRALRELRDALAEAHPQVVELSMGMSFDYAVAVEEGATMVRIGTALFGTRPPVDQGRT